MKKLMISLCCIVVLTSLLASYATASSPALPPENYKGPVAERPTFQPGEYWSYERPNGEKLKWVFEGNEGNYLVFLSGSKKVRLITTLDLGQLKRIEEATGKVTWEATNPEDIRFPLWIGKTWSFPVQVKSENLGGFVTVWVNYAVVGYKSITVKAGDFEAFEIRREWKAQGFTDAGEETFWYSPLVKHIIKYEGEHPRELTGYKKPKRVAQQVE